LRHARTAWQGENLTRSAMRCVRSAVNCRGGKSIGICFDAPAARRTLADRSRPKPLDCVSRHVGLGSGKEAARAASFCINLYIIYLEIYTIGRGAVTWHNAIELRDFAGRHCHRQAFKKRMEWALCMGGRRTGMNFTKPGLSRVGPLRKPNTCRNVFPPGPCRTRCARPLRWTPPPLPSCSTPCRSPRLLVNDT